MPIYHNPSYRWLARYGGALLAIGAAVLLRLALTRLAGPGLPTYVTFYPAVMLVSLLAGVGPGLLATVAAALVADFWLLAPQWELGITSLADLVGLALFMGMGVFISVIAGSYRRAARAVMHDTEAFRQPGVEPPAQRFLLNAGMLISLAILAIAGWRAVRSFTAVAEAGRQTAQSYVVSRELDGLFSAVKDAETGQRGYLLTGEESYLEPYNTALTQVEPTCASLKQLTRDNPSQQQRLDGLAGVIEEKLAELKATIELRRGRGPQPAEAMVASGRGRSLMDDIRRRVAAARAEEQRRLQQRTEATEAGTGKTLSALLAGGVLSLSLVATVFVFLKRENARRFVAETALRRHRDRLEEMVTARTAELERANERLKQEITEHEAAKEALVQQREWLQVTLSSIGDAVIATDTAARITFFNPVATALTGWPESEALGQPAQSVFRLINEQTRSPGQDIVERVLREGSVLALANHTTLLARDGRELSIEDSAAPIKDSHGAVVGVVVVFHDVTERRHAQAALRASEERNRFLADLLEHSDQPFATGYPDGALGYTNSAFERLTGYTQAELRTLDWAQVLTPPEWRASERAKLEELVRTRQPVRYQKEYLRKDGSRVPIELLVHLATDPAGAPLHYYSFLTDLTPRRQAEAAIRQANAQLAERVAELERVNEALQTSRVAALNLMEDAQQARRQTEAANAGLARAAEQRRLALEAADLGAWDYHFEQGEVAWDQRCRDMWGIAAGAQIDYAEAIHRIHPEDRPGVAAAVQRALAGHDGGAYHREFRVVWPDGSVHWIASHGRVYFEGESEARRARRFTGANREITAEKQAAEWLRESEDRLRLAIEAAELGTWDFDPVSGQLTWSERCKAVFGLPPDAPVNYEVFLGRLRAQDRAHVDAQVQAALDPAGTGRFELEYVAVWPDGTEHWISASGRAFFANVNGQPRAARFIGTVLDITGRKCAEDELQRLNRTLKALRSSSQAMLRATSEPGYLNEVCRLVTEDCGHAMVWIGYAEMDEAKSVRPVAHAGFEEGYLETLDLTWADTERGRGPTGTAIRTGQLCVCRNMLTDPAFAPWRDQALQRGYAASLALPLVADGQPVGALTIYSRQPDPFSDEELKLLTQLAEDVSYCITALRLRRAHGRAEEALKQSEERYRGLVELSPDAIFINRHNRVVFLNPAALRLFGADTPDQLLGKSPPDLFHPDYHAFIHERIERLLGGEPQLMAEEKIVRLDGTPVEVEVVASPLVERSGTAIQVILRDISERKRAARRTDLLAETASRLLQADSPQRVVEGLCQQVLEFLDCQAFFNFLVEEPQRRLHLNAYGGIPPEEARRLEWLDYGVAVCGCAARDACRIIAEDLQHTPDPRAELVKGYGIQAYACHPLLVEGRLLGTLSFGTRTRTRFTEDELSLMKAVADQVAIAMDRQRTNQALRLANEQLEQRVAERTAEVRQKARYARSLLEASLDPLVTIGPERRITDVNQATEAATGLARDRLVGTDFGQYFTQPDQADAGYQRVLAEGLVRDYPLTIRHVSGRTTEVLYNAAVYRNEVGEVQGVFAAARDVTALRRMELVVQRSEARYRSLVAATTQIVWATDPQGEIVEALPGWQAFTGQTFAEYQGAGWAQAVHPDDRQRTTAAWLRAVATRSFYETEYRMRRHDGQYRQMLARGVPVLEADGTIREWVGTCTDLTERREAERRRDFTSALLALFAQKATAGQYLDAVREVISQWSGCQAVGLRLAQANRELSFVSCAGFEPEFLALEERLVLGQDACICPRVATGSTEPQERDCVTPGGSFRCDNSAALLGAMTASEQARYRGNCVKFGYLSLAMIPVRYRDQVLGLIHLADRRLGQFPPATVEFIEAMAPLIGEAVHRFQTEAELANHRDHLEVLVTQRTDELVHANARLEREIVERRQAQETLQHLTEDLKRSNHDLEQFAYVASHDLQEPLRAVGGYVKLLQRRFPDKLDAKGLEYINGAVDGAARMERLITDLLAFSRVGSRGGAFAPADLNALLADALINLHTSIKNAHAKITRDHLPVLPVDATQIMQLLQNLIGNALKFRGDRPPEIHVQAERQEDRWVFAVRDNGIGIDSQYFERIFQIFQRLHTRKQYPGTGIGLAICKKIVERHGGTIWVESRPGEGATFYFSIPL